MAIGGEPFCLLLVLCVAYAVGGPFDPQLNIGLCALFAGLNAAVQAKIPQVRCAFMATSRRSGELLVAALRTPVNT